VSFCFGFLKRHLRWLRSGSRLWSGFSGVRAGRFGGFTNDERWRNADSARLLADPAFDAVDEDAGGACAHFVAGLHDGREMGMEGAVHGEIVEGGKCDVLRAADVQFLECLEHAERHDAIADEDGGWAR